MNVLDKLITAINPVAGVRRAQARLTLDQVRKYDGAQKGRRTQGWHTTGASATVEAVASLATLRNRSRDLVRNNEWCKKALASWSGNAIGTGITCSLDNHKQLGKLWKKWAGKRTCDATGDSNLYGLQLLAARCMWESGEVLIRKRWRRPEDKLPVPLQLQVLEPDFLDSDKFEDAKGGGQILAGIEFDAIGRRVAYWLFDQHPGEMGRFGHSLTSKRIPADQIIHLFKKERPGQVRGVPELAVAIMRARDLADYEDAELTRKKIEACFTVFVTAGDVGNSNIGAVEREQGGKGRWIEKIAPGLIKRLSRGEEVSFAQPTPSAGYPDYTRTQLRAMAAGTLVTYEQLTGDYSQVNYSSSRAGMLEFRRNVEVWQWLTFIPQFCDAVAEAFVEAARLGGKFKGADPDYTWTTPRWEWVDPVKDAKGEILEVAAGMKSLTEAIRRRGYDPEEVFAELAEDYRRLHELGIPISLDNLVKLASAAEEPDPANPKQENP